jgi:hypothetical protein
MSCDDFTRLWSRLEALSRLEAAPTAKERVLSRVTSFQKSRTHLI